MSSNQKEAPTKKENRTRVKHDYKVGDLVLIIQKPYKRKRKAKINTPTEGPFPIIRTYSNGNVRIQRRHYEEDISIRRLRPYHQTD